MSASCDSWGLPCGELTLFQGACHPPPVCAVSLQRREEEEEGPADPEGHQRHAGLCLHKRAACGLWGDVSHSQPASTGGCGDREIRYNETNKCATIREQREWWLFIHLIQPTNQPTNQPPAVDTKSLLPARLVLNARTELTRVLPFTKDSSL